MPGFENVLANHSEHGGIPAKYTENDPLCSPRKIFVFSVVKINLANAELQFAKDPGSSPGRLMKCSLGQLLLSRKNTYRHYKFNNRSFCSGKEISVQQVTYAKPEAELVLIPPFCVYI